MGLVIPPLEAYAVHHLPLVKAYADTIGLVEAINGLVPCAMGVKPGLVVLGLVLDTLSGRSPLYRLADFFAQQDTALLLGEAVAPELFTDDTVGRVLDRLYAVGTMKVFTACAVRADHVFGLDKRSVHFDTTSVSVTGDYRLREPSTPAAAPEADTAPVRLTHGSSKDKRPDLKQFVLATLCVDRAVPLWGQAEDGNVSDKTVNNAVGSELATHLATHGVAPGAYIYVADAALVTEDNLTALGDTLFITRLPATYHECARLITEAVARNTWADLGRLAQTKPTAQRPGTSYKVAEGTVTRAAQTYRAVVVHSSAADTRRQQKLEHALQTSSTTLQQAMRTAAQEPYNCYADAEAAAAKLRALATPYHTLDVMVEERPQYGRGRPSTCGPRRLKAMRYGVQATLQERPTAIAQARMEAGCFVLLTNVPTHGQLAHSAQDILQAYKEQHGTEHNDGFLKNPLIVNRLFLKNPARIEALGMVLLLALLLWRLMERALRTYVATTDTTLPGWDKKSTARPTTFMLWSKFAGLIVLKQGTQRQLARPLSDVQQQYLRALGVSPTCFTDLPPPAGEARL